MVLHELGLALALAPDREDLREELQRISTLVDERRTEQYERLAQEEEAAGHWSAAAGAWMRVAGSQPDSAYPARRAALALLQAGERLDQARSLAERAVRIEGDSVGHRIVLVQVLLGLSDLEGASKQLQIVTGLDPDSELVKDLQRQLVLAGHGD